MPIQSLDAPVCFSQTPVKPVTGESASDIIWLDWTFVSVPELRSSAADGSSSDAVLLRRRIFSGREHRARARANREYQMTGDVNVFRPFLAPFVRSDKTKELGPWEWSEAVERWFRVEKSTGSILWAPLPESFI
ncbi:hypothetical protein B0T26DRAFT_407377 [Lasiosphaeria miniovina]|uniref:Uncharacterized protein n=1 Tax=Lasiosphaeria miniovina TaxID=1954250 RepID=A0AA40DMT0_9PEZI|nr:uncharacterized protein B0T26DRAFT_407377 [Lasiosphaeria miniovina]KAK0709474.1 hypothetical protein B0T26DRAFT_407377 [Lasiosphaeria miniovina]